MTKEQKQKEKQQAEQDMLDYTSKREIKDLNDLSLDNSLDDIIDDESNEDANELLAKYNYY